MKLSIILIFEVCLIFIGHPGVKSSVTYPFRQHCRNLLAKLSNTSLFSPKIGSKSCQGVSFQNVVERESPDCCDPLSSLNSRLGSATVSHSGISGLCRSCMQVHAKITAVKRLSNDFRTFTKNSCRYSTVFILITSRILIASVLDRLCMSASCG